MIVSNNCSVSVPSGSGGTRSRRRPTTFLREPRHERQPPLPAREHGDSHATGDVRFYKLQGQLVIRQRYEDEDNFIFFSREHIPALVAAINEIAPQTGFIP